MQFSQFSQYLEQLESTASRLDMTSILARLYKDLKEDELAEASYLLEGQLRPTYESLEFQLSVKMVVKALARMELASQGKAEEQTDLFGQANNADIEKTLTKRYKQLGDVGLLAEDIVGQNSTAKNKLSLTQVYDKLVAIAQDSGQGSQERKLVSLVDLLKQLDAVSAKYVCRIIIGKLRLGFSTMTMLDALSWAVNDSKEDSAKLEEAFQKKADLGKLSQVYLSADSKEDRAKALEDHSTEEGIPVLPQLCQRLNDPAEIIEKMGTVIAEPKYDGLRVQIHLLPLEKGETNQRIKAFTRNLEDVTHMFPELLDLSQFLEADSAVLDAEAIGYDRTTGALLPFQATITRKRKHAVTEAAKDVPLKFFIFDVIALNGEPLLDKKLQKRKDLLDSVLTKNEVFLPTEYIVTSDPNELQTFHEHQLAEGLEGAVIKQVDAPYQSGRKSYYWVKIKEKTGTRGKLTDTLDCVVLGYYYGRGKRTTFGIGAFLVGVLTEDQQLQTIAKIGTGLSDDQFKEMKQRVDAIQVAKQPSQYQVAKELVPDVWCSPQIVVEIAADEVTKSPLHSAKYALRFPRLVKFRDDKDWTDATSVAEVKQLIVVSN